jgi:hypothetical protein
MAQIFISYSRADTQFISDLVPLLQEAYGVTSIFYDEQIPGGTKWWEMILREIAACDLFIYLCSNDSLQSPYCQSELREAVRLQKQILPVIVRPKTNYPYAGVDYSIAIPDDVAIILRDTNCIDLSKGFRDRDAGPRASAKLYRGINEALKKAPTSPQQPLTPNPTVQPQVNDKKKRSWLNEPRAIIIAAVITGVFVIVAVFIPLIINGQTPPQSQETETPTSSPSLTTQEIAAATIMPSETSTPTTSPSNTSEFLNTPTPTLTPSPTATSTPQPTDTSTRISILTITATFTATPTSTMISLQLIYDAANTFDYRLGNQAWRQIEYRFDDITMVLVPSGCFTMGNAAQFDEEPVSVQCFEEPFWIDQTEVTNEAFGSVGCTEWSSAPNQPRNCVSWFEARDFCESRGGRLPTEAEWEYAARGPDNLIYPWGNSFAAENVVYSQNSGGTSAVVGSRPLGASWVGAYDMVGNLGEWTNSLFQNYPYDRNDDRESIADTRRETSRVWRGGGFGDHEWFLRTSNRYRGGQGGTDRYGGFRCVRPI